MPWGPRRPCSCPLEPSAISVRTRSTPGPAQLARDHANARLLGESLVGIPGIEVDLETVQVNMVHCRVRADGRTEDGLVDHLGRLGFDVDPPTAMAIRFVTSREVDRDDIVDLVTAVEQSMS